MLSSATWTVYYFGKEIIRAPFLDYFYTGSTDPSRVTNFVYTTYGTSTNYLVITALAVSNSFSDLLKTTYKITSMLSTSNSFLDILKTSFKITSSFSVLNVFTNILKTSFNVLNQFNIDTSFLLSVIKSFTQFFVTLGFNVGTSFSNLIGSTFNTVLSYEPSLTYLTTPLTNFFISLGYQTGNIFNIIFNTIFIGPISTWGFSFPHVLLYVSIPIVLGMFVIYFEEKKKKRE